MKQWIKQKMINFANRHTYVILNHGMKNNPDVIFYDGSSWNERTPIGFRSTPPIRYCFWTKGFAKKISKQFNEVNYQGHEVLTRQQALDLDRMMNL